MKKLTKEEFIQRALLIHNNKYLYDKVNYINTQTKVIITCPIHGDFENLCKLINDRTGLISKCEKGGKL